MRAPFLMLKVASRHGDARRETFDVPFPRSRERLVEVDDVEEEISLRGREHSEVGEVCVTTGLHAVASHRGAGQVVGHELRGTAQEREGRDHHPLVAHGHEVRDAGRIRRFEARDGIGPPGIGLPPCVPRTRHLLTARPAFGAALFVRLRSGGRHHPQ